MSDKRRFGRVDVVCISLYTYGREEGERGQEMGDGGGFRDGLGIPNRTVDFGQGTSRDGDWQPHRRSHYSK